MKRTDRRSAGNGHGMAICLFAVWLFILMTAGIYASEHYLYYTQERLSDGAIRHCFTDSVVNTHLSQVKYTFVSDARKEVAGTAYTDETGVHHPEASATDITNRDREKGIAEWSNRAAQLSAPGNNATALRTASQILSTLFGQKNVGPGQRGEERVNAEMEADRMRINDIINDKPRPVW